MKNAFRLFFIFVAAITFGGCTEFGKALEFQDNYASKFSTSKSNQPISLTRGYYPRITRGIIATQYLAVLPEGEYIPVASSNGRILYQAPVGFKYKVGTRVDSRVGGIVQMEKGNYQKFYVWFFARQSEYFEVEPNGDWVNDIKPGFLNFMDRPWVEEDLNVIM